MKIIVIKFGGTSVGSIDRIKKVTKIIISYVKRKYRVIVITSAMSGVTNELLSFVGLLCEKGDTTNIPIIDDNDVPVKIPDLNVFFDDIMDVYFQSSNEYHAEYEKIRTKRKVSGLVDYDEDK